MGKKTKLKIAFTYDAKAGYELKPGDPPDKYAEFDKEETILQVESALKSGGYEVERINGVKKLIGKINSGERWDAVFNICEGTEGRNREGWVPAVLEIYGIPYIGSDVLTMGIALDKILSKKLADYCGIKTPDYVCVNRPEEIEKNMKWIKEHLPVIVKPSHEGTSKGLSQKSLCRNFEEARERIGSVVRDYSQPALVEKFIKGYEFTVAVVGNGEPEVFPPVQVAISGKEDLGEDFYTYERVISPEIDYFCPAKISAKLDAQLRRMALDAYNALECRDFGRVDMRVDYEMTPYFLELNPLPNIGLEDVFPLIAQVTGRTYEEIICLVVESGLKRLGLGH